MSAQAFKFGCIQGGLQKLHIQSRRIGELLLGTLNSQILGCIFDVLNIVAHFCHSFGNRPVHASFSGFLPSEWMK